LALAACRSGGPKTVIVNEQNADSKVKLHKSDILELTLVGNPSTGYIWEPQSLDTTILKQKGEMNFKPDCSEPGFAGSPGKLTMRFEAIGSGKTTLQMIHHQPWDTVAPPTQTFKMTVVVK
jgi:predicted secreted protein